jgi:hypothetical protein
MTDEIKPEDKRSYTPGYDLRPMQEADVESVLAGFNAVFSEGNPDFVARTMEEWEWAYRKNPAGTRVLVAVKEGEVAAHFSSLPVRVWIGGEERLFGQSVDSYVLPAHRQGLRRPGLYAKLVWEFQDLYGGRDKDLLHFGWPVWNAWRIGKALLSYEVVRTQNLLVKAVPADADQAILEGCERDGLRLEVIDRFDEQARWLWDRCSGAWGASAIRDDAFLNWRIFDHPKNDYTVLGVRDGDGILRGYAIFRFGAWIEPDMGLLVDWLVPPDEPLVAGLLHDGLMAAAARDGAATVTGIFPDWSHWFESFQDLAWRVTPSEYFMMGVYYHKRYDMLWLRKNWWYLLIDTDLV